jgi:hypothetical protein
VKADEEEEKGEGEEEEGEEFLRGRINRFCPRYSNQHSCFGC